MLNAHLDRRPMSALARLVTLLVMASAALPLAAATAQTPSVLSGTLRDTSGRVLPEAGVRLVQADGVVKYEVQADAAGQFQFTGVQPADQIPGYTRDQAHLAVGVLVEAGEQFGGVIGQGQTRRESQ